MFDIALKKGICDFNAANPLDISGADERNRTADLLITNQLLYHLSYIGFCIELIRAIARAGLKPCAIW